VKDRNPARHLETALEYIQNGDKTEEKILVGSINCLPETAYEQMLDTKQIFGKTNKRQGYHIIISFPPDEATPEQAFEVTRRFAEEHLGENYEVVYSVHTDKAHNHGHIVWNSVSFVDGKKYDSPKGNWKYHLQPLTNKFCKELGLSIQPAEYSKNPVNMSREKWEFEQSFKELIYRDARLCATYAGSVDHFLYLMKRIGYEFKQGAYLTVKVPGRKLYHKLDKMDEMFQEGEFKYYLGSPYTVIPHYYAKDFWNYKRSNLTPYQKKFYAKMYRLRIVEQKKFYVNSARYAEDLKRFHLLQDEYLMIVNNDIKDFGDLIDYKIRQEKRHEEIDKRQHKIYAMTKAKRGACKSEDDWREFQDWNLGIQKELQQLKEEKQKTKYNQKLAGRAMKENLSTALYVVSEDEPIKTNYEMEVPTYFEAERPKHAAVDYEEYIFTDNRDVIGDYPVAEPVVEVTQLEAIEQELAASLDAGACDKSEAESDLDNAPVIDAGVEVEEGELSVSVYGLGDVASGDSDRKSESVIRSSDGHDSIVRMPLTYSEYRFMTYSDKSKAFGVAEDMPVNDIVKVIRDFYDNCGHEYDFDGLMDEADMIFKAARRDSINEAAENTAQVIEMLYESYKNTPLEGKVGLFDFKMDDANYNLSLHREVLRLLGIKMDIEEMMDDYQKIYEEKMVRELEERSGKDKQFARGRGR
jgi:hypothetical protein